VSGVRARSLFLFRLVPLLADALPALLCGARAGGTSLLAMRLVGLIRGALDPDMSVGVLMMNNTVEALARVITAKEAYSAATAADAANKDKRAGEE
jgi:hypothetical protein